MSSEEPDTNTPELADSAVLFSGYKSFYNSHAFSDFTVVCGERRWKVHKLVVSANSKYIHKACAGEFRASSSKCHCSQSRWH